MNILVLETKKIHKRYIQAKRLNEDNLNKI